MTDKASKVVRLGLSAVVVLGIMFYIVRPQEQTVPYDPYVGDPESSCLYAAVELRAGNPMWWHEAEKPVHWERYDTKADAERAGYGPCIGY